MSLYCLHKIKFKAHYQDLYGKALFSSIHSLSFFVFSILINTTQTHKATTPNIQAHTSFPQGYSTQSIGHINFSVLYMPTLYVICAWFYLIWWCFLIASYFSHKIISSWTLLSTYFLPPTKYPSLLVGDN